MVKRYVMKLVVGLAIMLTLLGGVTVSGVATAAKAAPAHHLLACGGGDGLPPCI